MISPKNLTARLLNYIQDSNQHVLTRRKVLATASIAAWEMIDPSISYSRLLNEEDLEGKLGLIKKNNEIREVINNETSKFNDSNASYSFEIAPEWMYSLVALESSFNPRRVSIDGAKGLCQLTEAAVIDQTKTAALYHSPKIFYPDVNTNIGLKHFALYLNYFIEGATKEDRDTIKDSIPSFTERFKFALAGYNTGAFRVINRILEHAKSTNSKSIRYEDIEQNFDNETRDFVPNNLLLLGKIGVYSQKDNSLINPRTGNELRYG